MTKWTKILETNWDQQATRLFALGAITGKEFYNQFAGKTAGGAVRNLLRKHGVQYSRRLARKSLRRRGLLT